MTKSEATNSVVSARAQTKRLVPFTSGAIYGAWLGTIVHAFRVAAGF